jgi:hypothetical protein
MNPNAQPRALLVLTGIVAAAATVSLSSASANAHKAVVVPAPAFSEVRGVAATLSAAAYSAAVARICAGALLFDGAHQMGTRADALAVARDIRVSSARRLARVAALAVPPELRATASRWIASQRRLAADYALAWVRIYDTIDAARTPPQRATLAQHLHRLVHLTDPLRLVAGRLEQELNVPDCTGGSTGGPPDSLSPTSA